MNESDAAMSMSTKLKLLAFHLVLGGAILGFLFARDTRSGSGTIEMAPPTTAANVSMATQVFRHRYVWLWLREGESATFEPVLQPDRSATNMAVRPLFAPWRRDSALLCNDGGSLTFRAPHSGPYVFHVTELRKMFGGTEPTIRIAWSVGSASSAGQSDVWSSYSLFRPRNGASSTLKQLQRCFGSSSG